MTSLHLDIAAGRLIKAGEELCGDSVEVASSDTSTVIVLSDGLGSGVKANILSSLTAKMAATMLKEGLPVDEVIATLAATLPVCEVRRLAYSTFAILQIFADGSAYLAEYDSPRAYIGTRQYSRAVERQEREVSGKKIKESYFKVKDGDWVVLVTDGILHAGIGGIWNLGWGEERVGKYVEGLLAVESPAQAVADEVVRLSDKLYAAKPGDDGTCVVVKVRGKRRLTMLVGPPVDRQDDARVVSRLLAEDGLKVVCGGTTANIVARETGKQVAVDLATLRKDIPPTGEIEGIDLVTEGMLTLTHAADLVKAGRGTGRDDGANCLAQALLSADEIHIIVGRAINPAHQSPDVPASLALKPRIVDEMVRNLEMHHKRVTVEYH